MLDHDGKILRESLLIVDYVNEAFPGASLYPASPFDKYLSRLIVSEADSTLIGPFYTALKNQDRSKDAEYSAKVLGGIKKLNDWLLKTNPKGTFFFGDDLTYADIAMAPFAERVVLVEEYRQIQVPDTEEYRRFLTWRNAVLAHPDVASTLVPKEDLIAGYVDYSLGVENGKLAPGKAESSFKRFFVKTPSQVVFTKL